MTRRRYALLAACLVVVAGVVLGLLLGRGRAKAKAPESAVKPTVGTALVRRGEFFPQVTGQGRIGPPAGSSAKVAFAVSGIVQRIDVRVGDRVAAGTILAELDRSALAAAVDQARADAAAAANQYGGGAVPADGVRSAQAKLALADAKLRTLERGGPAAQSDQIAAQQALRQAELRVETDRATVARDRTLLAGGVIPQKDLETAQTQLANDLADQRAAEAKAAATNAGFAAALRQARADRAQAQADLRSAQAQPGILGAQASSAGAKLEAAQVAYRQGVLRAPNGGVVIAILKHDGEAVDPTTPVIEIGPGAANAITLSVPAETATRVHVGDPVRVTLERSGIVARGRVSAVVPAVDPATQAATVTATGALPGAVPGDAVTASITTGRLAGALVPSSAIVEDPQTGKTVVFVQAKDGSFGSRRVAVTASDATTALVASGLHPGERIATQGSYELLAPAGG